MAECMFYRSTVCDCATTTNTMDHFVCDSDISIERICILLHNSADLQVRTHAVKSERLNTNTHLIMNWKTSGWRVFGLVD